jgi:excisionase family DNA binding protein
MSKHPLEPMNLRVPDSCHRWGIGRAKLYELIAEGHLIARKAGARTLIDREAGDAYFSSLPRIPARVDAA